jgi:hypothetical protein
MNYGPKWQFLSENLQADLMKFIFTVGIRPEIAICIEYLSWNKEQRLYMGWIRDIYAYLFVKIDDNTTDIKFKLPNRSDHLRYKSIK